MAFGQSPGYPATRSQMEELNELILEAGHVDFRDARGPLGLTQRQAGGKFTRDEADALIASLRMELEGTTEAGSGELEGVPAIEDTHVEPDEPPGPRSARTPLPPRAGPDHLLP